MAQDNVLKRRTLSILTALAVCTLIIGCGSHDPQSIAAHKIADALPDIIGPAKRYDVSVEGNPFSLSRGHVSRVKIDGRDVRLSPSLTMTELHVDAHDLAVDKNTHQVTHAGEVDVTGVMGQLQLDEYLAGMKSGIDGLAVQIRWTDLEATVPVSAFHVDTTVHVDGSLEPSASGADKLDFVPSGGGIGVVPVPRKLVQLAMDRLNPVLDLSNLKFPLSIQSAQAVNGRIYVKGTTTLSRK